MKTPHTELPAWKSGSITLQPQGTKVRFTFNLGVALLARQCRLCCLKAAKFQVGYRGKGIWNDGSCFFLRTLWWTAEWRTAICRTAGSVTEQSPPSNSAVKPKCSVSVQDVYVSGIAVLLVFSSFTICKKFSCFTSSCDLVTWGCISLYGEDLWIKLK